MLGEHGLWATRGKKHAAIHLLSQAMRIDGNTGKLDAARVLLGTMAWVFTGNKVCLCHRLLVYERVLDHLSPDPWFQVID